jgi:translation initiation factor IF-2
MFTKIAAGEAKEFPVVIKGDVQGSVEAIVSSLNQLSTSEVKARVLHAAVGGINESDVTLARASGGIIIGFNVRANQQATEKRTALAPTNFDTMFTNLQSDVTEFPLLVKADVQGSVEAIVTALHNLSNDEIKVRVLHAGVGAITESDVTLAAASGAPIIGFNVRPNPKARELVERNKVRMMYYDVIYHLTEEIGKEMAGVLGPLKIENVLGRAEVKQVFPAGKRDKAAGLLVTEGVIRKGLHARLTRQDVIVSATTIASLRRFKDDVDEVRAGLECGVVLADTNDIKAGDMLEVFEVEERERTL